MTAEREILTQEDQPLAEELTSEEIDQVVGAGITPLLHRALVNNEAVKTIKDGVSNTLMAG